MINRILNNNILNERPTESVTAAAFIIALSGIVSRVLGLFRDRILASNFGAGDMLDVYYASFRIPDLIYNLLILGALSAAFIPVFTGLLSKNRKDEAWEMASGVLNLSILVVMGLSLVLWAMAPGLLDLMAPGFSDDKLHMTVIFTRIMFLSPLLLGISAVFGGILVSLKKFVMYSVAPIFYNIGIIIGALVLVPYLGPTGLAWGVVLGALLHSAIQFPSVHSSGFRFSRNIFSGLKNGEVGRVMKLMIPRILSVAVTQFNLLVITIFASTLRSGSLTVFSFANNIQSAPLGLFGISFAIAVFPVLSDQAARDNRDSFIRSFSKAFRQVIFFIIPLSFLIIVLRAQIVRLILGAGEFDWEDTILTFETLGILSASLFAQSLIPLLTRSFYALQNTRTPFYVALASEVLNISLVLMLIGKYAVSGLAMAFSIASVLNAALLFYFLRQKMGGLDDRTIGTAFLKIISASALAALGAQVAKYSVGAFFEINTFVAVLVQLLVATALGLGIFLFMCVILEIDEFKQLKGTLGRKIFGAKEQIVEDSGEVQGI